MLAHELLRTPAPLRNSIEVISSAGSDAQIRDRARDTDDRQLTQMEQLIEDLLDIARITRNKLILRRAPLDLAGVIQQALEGSRPLAEAAKHEVTVHLPAEPLRVHGDTVRLAQVFGNLLSNACKYTDPGGHIAVRGRREAGEIVVSVQDDGIGIRRPAAAVLTSSRGRFAARARARGTGSRARSVRWSMHGEPYGVQQRPRPRQRVRWRLPALVEAVGVAEFESRAPVPRASAAS
jgi:K+-sensing histidine kinase KdpD